MKCPSCHSPVAEDAAICPNCDHILDPTLFDASPPVSDDDEDEKTGPKAAPPQRPPSGSRPAVKKPPAPKPSSEGGGGGAVKKPKGRPMPEAPAPVQREARGNWRDKVEKEDWGPAPVAKEPGKRESIDPDDHLADVRRFIYELSTADKLGLFGAIGMLLACFFPWKETVTDGAVLGLLSSGALVFGGAVLGIGAIAVRVRKLMGDLNPVFPWVIQLAAIGASIFWCVVYLTQSWDRTLVRAPFGNEEIYASKPSLGVILAILAGGVAGLGTIFGLKETRN